MNSNKKNRIIITFFILLIIIFILGFRLFWIQIVKSGKYKNIAVEQRVKDLKVQSKRGQILDRNGNKLAVNIRSKTVVAIPYEIENPKITAEKLSNILEMNYNYIYERITREASAVYIKRKIDDSKVKQIESSNLKGITFIEESKRYYPNDALASHLLGFAGVDNQGLEGIELSFDKYLKGTPGKIVSERDAAGRNIPGGTQSYIEPQAGYSLVLTIDEVLQYTAERELDKALNKYNISGGTIIAMRPDTGSILALANRPDFDLNNFNQFPQKYWRNRSISDSFEPGSTFKIITAASALEQGIVNEKDIFVDPGNIKIKNESIDCWKYNGHGVQTFAEVVQNSCNPGFVQLGLRLGKNSFYNYIKAFGFGDETDIELPGESQGMVYKKEEIRPVELATMSFGHGITVTPIQLVTAVSAVANDGILMKPKLVKEIRKNNGQLFKENKSTPIRKVISPQSALKIRKLLENVVENGTGKNAQIKGYSVGGKTGTAEHYTDNVYDSSFIGMVPIEDPELVILVVLYDISGESYYGSETAAPIFKKFALDALRYLEISPEKKTNREDQGVNNQSEEKIILPDLNNNTISGANRKLNKLGIQSKIIGNKEKVVQQIPYSSTKVEKGSTVFLFTDKSFLDDFQFKVVVPNLNGLSRSETENILNKLGLRASFKGKGKVVKQGKNPGERIKINSELKISLN